MHRVFSIGSQLSREGLKSLLAGSVFTSSGQAHTLEEAHHLLCRMDAIDECPHLLAVDFNRPLLRDDGEILRRIRVDRPAVKVIVLGNPRTLGLLWQVCGTEIDGYLLHDMPPAALIHSFHLIVLGLKIFPPSPIAAAGTPPIPDNSDATEVLSAQEKRILVLLLDGASNKAIARDLSITDATVKTHMRHILRKIKAQNRTQAALWAAQHGLRMMTVLALSL